MASMKHGSEVGHRKHDKGLAVVIGRSTSRRLLMSVACKADPILWLLAEVADAEAAILR